MATNEKVVTLSALTQLKNNLDTSYTNKFVGLDEHGVAKAEQLPSYVDDVIEGYFYNSKFYKETAHTTEINGETGKIYVDIGADPAKVYRYSGTTFIEINSNVSQAEKAVKDGSGNIITETYVKKTDLATNSNLGIVKIGSNIAVNNGEISVNDGDTTKKGVVQVGSNINSNNGVISVNEGTSTQKGVLQVGSNINVNSGVISVNDASTTQKGVLKIGSNITVNNGEISISGTNITTALGYTPLDESEFVFATDADIDALFA